jgi:hypothetical protein
MTTFSKSAGHRGVLSAFLSLTASVLRNLNASNRRQRPCPYAIVTHRSFSPLIDLVWLVFKSLVNTDATKQRK